MATVFGRGQPQIQGKILPITDFSPDVDPITPGAMVDVENLYPTWKGWRTYPSLVRFTDSIGTNCRILMCGNAIVMACGKQICVTILPPTPTEITLHAVPGFDVSVDIAEPDHIDLPATAGFDVELTTLGCPEDTVPTGSQNPAVVFCYNYHVPLQNDAGQSINFVQGNPFVDTESFIATTSLQSGFLANYETTEGVRYNIWQATGKSWATTTRVPLASAHNPAAWTPGTFSFFGQTAQAGITGSSDEDCYLFGGGVSPALPTGATGVLGYFSKTTNSYTLLRTSNISNQPVATGTWAKRGDRFWSNGTDGIGVVRMARFSMSLGDLPVAEKDITPIMPDGTKIYKLQATANFLYALYHGAPSKIFRLDLDTMDTVDTFTLPLAANDVVKMFVVSDDLIYILNGSTPFSWTFSYYIPSTDTYADIATIAKGCSGGPNAAVNEGNFYFKKGYFFITSGAAGTNTVEVGPLVCPGTSIPIGSLDP